MRKTFGTQYRVDAEEWAAYFELLSGWRWIASGEKPPRHYEASDYLKPVTNRADDMQVLLEPTGRARAGES